MLATLAQAASGGSWLTSYFGMMVLLVFIWWFVLFRPQRQQEAVHKKMLEELKTGTKVVTNGGIYGTVDSVGEKTLKLRIADKVRIDVLRSAITGLQPENKVN